MLLNIVGGGITKARSISTHSEQTVNFYPEVNNQNAKSQTTLIGTPALVLFTTVTSNTGACRVMFSTGSGRFFTVVGNEFIEIDNAGTQTIRGSLATQIGRITIAENVNVSSNLTQLFITDNSHCYTFDLSTNVFTDIYLLLGEGAPIGSHVVYKDGLFIINESNKNTFRFSKLYDGKVWNVLNFYAAESNSDNCLALGLINNELWVFGDRSIEIWYSTGIGSSPLARVQNAFIDIGIDARYSVATINNTIFFLGSNAQGNRIVYMANSYIPQRISDHNIEYMLNTFSDVSDAIGFCYQQEGHLFYILSFQNGNKTICFDMSTGFWHERAYFNTTTGENDRHRAICSTYWDNKCMIGDYANGKIYYFDLDTYTDNGVTIKRIRQTGHLHAERKRLFFKSLELDMETGIGLVSGQGSNPMVMLQWSNDGGFTWSNENWIDAGSAGAVGAKKTRCIWRRLGSSRNRVFRITMTDPVKWIINNAILDVEIENQ